MWPRLLWLSLLLVILFSILHLYRTTPGWVDSGNLDTAWATDRTWPMNNIRVHWDNQSGQLSVHHSDRLAWASTPGRPWLNVMSGDRPDLGHLSSGRFGRGLQGCQDQFWFDEAHDAEHLVLQGDLRCAGANIRAVLEISAAGPEGIQLEWSVDTRGDLELRGQMLEFELPASEGVYGFGQQTGNADHQGTRLVLSAFSRPTDKSGLRSGTLWPVGVTRDGRALVADREAHQVLDLRDADSGRLETWDTATGQLRILLADEPRQLLSRLADVVGTMPGLPDELHQRPVLGTSRKGESLLSLLNALGEENTPLGAVLLESPQRSGYPVSVDVMPWRPGRLEMRQADWPGLSTRLEEDSLLLLGTRNALVQPLDIDNVAAGETESLAGVDDIFLQGARMIDIERNGGGRRLLQLDLQRDMTRSWLNEFSQTSTLDAVAAWSADWHRPASGTETPVESARFATEQAALRRWQDWQLAQEEPVISDLEPWPVDSAGSRPAMLSTGQHATAWGPATGLQSSLSAMLSGGVSGLTVAHSPVGGTWSASRLWWPRYRDTELFLRWLELSTFTGWLRLHEGDQPDRHYQVTDSVSGRIHFDRLSRLYETLFPYRRQLMQEASEHGWPLVRPLWFTFPDDENTWSLPPDQFMFGDYLLVVPALASGVTDREFYLPAGGWTHLWDGRTFESDGETRRLRTPIGEPLVLIHDDFPYHGTLRERGAELAIGNILGAF